MLDVISRSYFPRYNKMTPKQKRRAPGSDRPGPAEVSISKPAAKQTKTAAVGAAAKAASRSLAKTASRPSKPAPSGIFAALEKARANMSEGDANLARARKILGR